MVFTHFNLEHFDLHYFNIFSFCVFIMLVRNLKSWEPKFILKNMKMINLDKRSPSGWPRRGMFPIREPYSLSATP